MKPTDILILTSKPLSAVEIACNARVVELAHHLDEAGFNVTLAIPNPELMPPTHYRVTASDPETIESLIRRHDTIISTGAEYTARQISHEDHFQVFDVAELSFGDLTSEPALEDRVSFILDSADLILCGSPFQRDFWLGLASGRGAFADLTRRSKTPLEWFSVVPYGQPGLRNLQPEPLAEPPEPLAPPDSIIWNGGYGPLYDAVAVVDAMVQITRAGSSRKCVFLPPPGFAPEETAGWAALKSKIAELDSRDTTNLLLLPDSISAIDRYNVLAKSACVVCCTQDVPDARLWHAAPLVEAVWLKVPFVCTRGPFMSYLADELEIGYPVAAGDVTDLTHKLGRICEASSQQAMRSNLDEVHSHFGWDRVIRPLLEFLQRPSQMVEHPPEEPGHWGRSVWRAVGRLFE